MDELRSYGVYKGGSELQLESTVVALRTSVYLLLNNIIEQQ